MLEKRAGGERIFDRAEHAQATVTLRAFEHVHVEGAAEQNRPRDLLRDVAGGRCVTLEGHARALRRAFGDAYGFGALESSGIAIPERT